MDEREIFSLPSNLPVPKDDGLCNHLVGMCLPNVRLPCTSGAKISLRSVNPKFIVVYCFPLAWVTGTELPPNWDEIPGARGCTPQSCAFRDRSKEIESFGGSIFGISTQTKEDQLELFHRLHLPFDLLSDNELQFASAMGLPTFQVAGMTLIRRVTLIAADAVVRKVFYPVFPPDRNAEQVLAWLRSKE